MSFYNLFGDMTSFGNYRLFDLRRSLVRSILKKAIILVLFFAVGMAVAKNKDLLLKGARIITSVWEDDGSRISIASGIEDDNTFVWPVPACTLVSENYTESSEGIEIACEGDDVEILAVKSGVVTKVESRVCKHESKIQDVCSSDGRGNNIIIKHQNGMSSYYQHLKYDSVKVKEGDVVEAGQVIGYMGSSGRSIKQHLFFQLRDSNQKPINVNKDKVNYKYNDKSKTSAVPKVKWKVKTDTANVRVGAGIKNRVIAIAPKGSVLEMSEEKMIENENWIKTRYNGKVGWCSCKCLEKISENINSIKVKNGKKISTYKESKLVAIRYNIIAGSIEHSDIIYHQGDTVHRYVFDTPKRKGYNFNGWYMDPNYNTPVPEEFVIDKNTNVYAKWTN